MNWPRDDAKLDRVRALMAEQELDALVVRAPDNVLYLTNFWGMKGYDAVVFPREGEPVLVCLEASEADAERMRLANEISARAMEHVQQVIRPGMRESEIGAIWNGWVHDHGTGFEGKVELAHGFSLVWSGEGIRTFTATGSHPIQEHEPTLFEIWVCADGYWCDHTKNLVPGELTERYAELEQQLLGVYVAAVDFCRPGASLAELDRMVREGLAELGYPGQPSHPICHGVGARAHEPPYAHQAGGGTVEAGMVLALEPGVYWPEGGGLRVEDNFLVTDAAPERLCRFPDGIVRTS